MIALAAIFVGLFAVAPYPADAWCAAVGVVVCGVALLAYLDERERP